MNYKHKLSVCICIKNEALYIIPFIKHYINQGVDHFYIINNNSFDNIEEIIEKSIFKTFVTLIKDERSMNISQAYSKVNGIPSFLNDNLYEIIIQETEWAIVVDIDEFIYGKNGFTCKTYLETISENVGCIYVLWNIMTSKNVKDCACTEFSISMGNFKRLNYDLINELGWNVKNSNDFGKSIFRTSMLNYKGIGLHKTHTKGVMINNYGDNKNSWYDNCNKIEYSEKNFKEVNITLNHYVIRHFEDFSKKKKQFEERKNFLKGVFEMFDLDDKYFIYDNEIMSYSFHSNKVKTLS